MTFFSGKHDGDWVSVERIAHNGYHSVRVYVNYDLIDKTTFDDAQTAKRYTKIKRKAMRK